jgi:hypothetical protein
MGMVHAAFLDGHSDLLQFWPKIIWDMHGYTEAISRPKVGNLGCFRHMALCKDGIQKTYPSKE